MKHLFFVLTTLTTLSLSAQDRYLVGSAGTYTQDVGGSVSWSLGEIMILTATGTSNVVKQGFQQGNLYVTGIEVLKEIEVNIFPNPTQDVVNINSDEAIALSVYDQSGRLVFSKNLNSGQNQLSVSDLARGTYLLSLVTAGGITKSVQLVVM